MIFELVAVTRCVGVFFFCYEVFVTPDREGVGVIRTLFSSISRGFFPCVSTAGGRESDAMLFPSSRGAMVGAVFVASLCGMLPFGGAGFVEQALSRRKRTALHVIRTATILEESADEGKQLSVCARRETQNFPCLNLVGLIRTHAIRAQNVCYSSVVSCSDAAERLARLDLVAMCTGHGPVDGVSALFPGGRQNQFLTGTNHRSRCESIRGTEGRESNSMFASDGRKGISFLHLHTADGWN